MIRNLFLLLAVLTSLPVLAQEKPPTEADYYTITPFQFPKGEVIEAGALGLMPDEKLAFTSRRGEIWLVDDIYTKNPKPSQFSRYAHGLHEVLGVSWRDGWLYVTQRCEVSKLRDSNNDGRADEFETVNAGWGITGDYHEYAFGSPFDKDGNIWVVLCLTGSFDSNAPYRGWCVRVTPEGELIPTCSGIRSPGGIGMNHLGDMFYTDNQGPWNGTCGLKHLAPGQFMGHPGGNKWYDLPEVVEAMGPRPKDPQSGSRIMVEAEKVPELIPTAVFFPYAKMGQSASGIVCDQTGGKFGPFENQLFVGDQTFSTVMRVTLEKINGRYQGACYPFLSGMGSGSLALQFTDKGSLFVAGTNRGWGSRGSKPFALDRIDWTGKVPFEVYEMKAKPDGFELVFTEEVDPETAGKVESYSMKTYTYIYQGAYGSPEVDQTTPTIKQATVSPDRKSVRLVIEGLQIGHVHELRLNGVRSAQALPILHPEAYYTLNYLPEN